MRSAIVGPMVVVLSCLSACGTTSGPDRARADGGLGGPNVAAPEASPASGSARASDVVITAMTYLDAPYRAGGLSQEQGFDCSGFTRHVYAQTLGLVLPRQADEQAQSAGLQTVGRAQLRAGDLVFFNTLQRTFSHVGIYVGEGKFIHAPRTGAQVRIESLAAPYWSRRFTGARRAAQAL